MEDAISREESVRVVYGIMPHDLLHHCSVCENNSVLFDVQVPQKDIESRSTSRSFQRLFI